MDFLEEVHPDGLAHDGVFLIPHGFEVQLDGRDEAEGTDQSVRNVIKDAQGVRDPVDHAEAGTRPPKVEREIDVPDELTDALDADPELAEAYHALTPGRQNSYLFNLNQAKQSATRVARIEKFRDRIIAGKGALER